MYAYRYIDLLAAAADLDSIGGATSSANSAAAAIVSTTTVELIIMTFSAVTFESPGVQGSNPVKESHPVNLGVQESNPVNSEPKCQ